MTKPNFQFALVEEKKIIEYLLSSEHDIGKDKAFVFLRRGFNPNTWEDFAQALKKQARNHDISEEIETRHGVRYNVDGALETPDGTNPRIRTVWQVDHGTDYPRLITAYPVD